MQFSIFVQISLKTFTPSILERDGVHPMRNNTDFFIREIK